MYSPSPSLAQPQAQQQQRPSWIEQFEQEREALGQEIAQQMRTNMATIIGHQPTADLLLVAADGKKMPAHLCILKRRAPSFFQRYVQTTLDAITPRNSQQRQLLEIAVGDVDSGALEFFIRSIYTDEEIYTLDWVDVDNYYTGNGGQGGGGQAANPNDHGTGRNNIDGKFGDVTTLENVVSSAMPNENVQYDQQTMTNKIIPKLMSASFPSPEEGGQNLISFRELAENSSLGEIKNAAASTSSSCSIPKYIGKSNKTDEGKIKPTKPPSIFPYFVDIGTGTCEQLSSSSATVATVMTRSLPSASVQDTVTGQRSESPFGSGQELIGTIRSRALAARRLSASSANSLTSIDLPTPSQDFPAQAFFGQIGQMRGASKLAEDLLQIFMEDHELADLRVLASDGEELAHSSILWANGGEYFRQQISSLKFTPSPGRLGKIELRRFSAISVRFLLQFIYGGLTSLPAAETAGDEPRGIVAISPLDPWELIELGAFTKLEMFIRVVALHIRTVFCHFFHRPCASCVSAVFEALPKMELEIKEMKQLFDDAMQWQALHFTRIWRGRVFLHLSEHWHKQCRDALLQSIDEENVIEVLLGSEKLQLTLARTKLQAMAQKVLRMVSDVEEYCLEFLANSLDSFIQSKAFSAYGHGLALNLALLEDILPTMIHSLSAETTIRSFLALKELLAQLEDAQFSCATSCTNSPLKRMPSSSRSSLYGSSQSIGGAVWREQLLLDEWNPRFKCLCHRLLALLDRHMLHYANSIQNSAEWNLLCSEDQNRIKENGLFVEMRMPRAAPPRLSSAGRHYKRSSSVGFSLLHAHSGSSTERSRSLERNASLGLQQLAGSRPSLSTQLEEELCESPVQNVDEIAFKLEQFSGQNTTNEKAKSPQRTTTKIPAKIAHPQQNKEKSRGQINVEMRQNVDEHVSKKIEKTEKKSKKTNEQEMNTESLEKESLHKTDVNKLNKTELKAEKTDKNKLNELEMNKEKPNELEINIEKQKKDDSKQKKMKQAKTNEHNKKDAKDEQNKLEMNMQKSKKDELNKTKTLNTFKKNADKSEANTEQNMKNEAKEKLNKEEKRQELNQDKLEMNQDKLEMNQGNQEKNQDKLEMNQHKLEMKQDKLEMNQHELEMKQDNLKMLETDKNEENPPETTSESHECNPSASTSTSHKKSHPIASQALNERQRTHTVMTVDQNLRAGINAYLESVGTSANPANINLQKNGLNKPQSIVRPMPKVPPPAAMPANEQNPTTNPPGLNASNAGRDVQKSGRRIGQTNTRPTRIARNTTGPRTLGGMRRPMTKAAGDVKK